VLQKTSKANSTSCGELLQQGLSKEVQLVNWSLPRATSVLVCSGPSTGEGEVPGRDMRIPNQQAGFVHHANKGCIVKEAQPRHHQGKEIRLPRIT
jgi:hypothetical protein